MITLGVVVVYLVVGALEVYPLLRRRRRAEAAAVAAITALGAVYAAGLLGGWPLPNPARLIAALFRPAAEFFGAL